MRTQHIGDVTVHRLADAGRVPAPVGRFFRNVEWQEVEEHADWLAPIHIDVPSKMLILSYHSFIVQTGRFNILVDACIGNDKDRVGTVPFHMQKSDYLTRMKALGVDPEKIDFVMCTHLHADHVGWNTKLENGRWVPTFPNARYVFARTEYEYWDKRCRANPDGPWQEASYFDSVLPIVEAGRADIVESDFEFEDGIFLEPTHGQSPGHVILNVNSAGQEGLFTGDILHHPVQTAHPDWMTVFCQDPEQARKTRRALLERTADTPTRVFPTHFPAPTVGRVASRGDAFIFNFEPGA